MFFPPFILKQHFLFVTNAKQKTIKNNEITIIRVEFSEIAALKSNQDFEVDNKNMDYFGIYSDKSERNGEKSFESVDDEENDL